MVDVMTLFRGKSSVSRCYLQWDRASALADAVICRVGTLDPGFDFDMPKSVDFLPDTMPKHPRKHDKYFTDGGMEWPDRYIIEF